MRSSLLTLFGALLLSACGGSTAPPPSSAVPPTSTASTTVRVSAGMPGSTEFVTASLDVTDPLAVIGCISNVAGECAATARVVLDHDARAELDAALAAVRAMPRCEPAGFAVPERRITVSTVGIVPRMDELWARSRAVR